MSLIEQFSELYEADKNRLYSYIHAFVSNSEVANDIFQETSLALWKDFHKFELGTNFSKWANGIAFLRVLTFRRKNKKYLLGLSDDFLQEFNNTLSEESKLSEPQQQKLGYLEHCRALLPTPLQGIYQSFYVYNLTAQDIADNTGRSIHAIIKSVHKLRQKIFDCVDEQKQLHED
jgi:RNA polymerase sigma-70 factor (ECF subfamily)